MDPKHLKSLIYCRFKKKNELQRCPRFSQRCHQAVSSKSNPRNGIKCSSLSLSWGKIKKDNLSFASTREVRADVAKVWVISFASSDLPPQALRLRSLASFQWQRCLQKVITILKHHLFWEKQEEIDRCLISPLPPGPPPPPPCTSPPFQFKKNVKKKKSPTGSVV